MTPRFAIDVIICTYNNAPSLKTTLGSLMRQRVEPGIDWAVLVVDNNCTDATADVVQQAMHEAAMPVSSVQEPEQGLTAARRRGVRSTARDWLAFVDDDCELAPDWLEKTAAFAAAHPACGAFGGRIELSWEAEPPSYARRFPFAYAGKDHGHTAHRKGWVAGLGMTVRRSALAESGWIDQPLLADRIGDHLVSGGDMEIGLRVAVRHEVWYNPACRITHIIPARRTTRAYLQRMMFGLGASRHNIAALTWRRSYASFVAMQLLMVPGLMVRGCLDAANEVMRGLERVGLPVTCSPAFGWISAMVAMWKMRPEQRSALLGAATARRAVVVLSSRSSC